MGTDSYLAKSDVQRKHS